MELPILLISCLLLLPRHITAFVFQKNFNILDSTVNNSRKDAIDVQYNIKIISRGRFVISGYFDLKIELDDGQFIDLQIFYKERASSNYKSILYAFPNNTLSAYINGPYQLVLMDTLQKCNSNFLYFKGVWLPPLKPLRAEMNNCNLTADKVPIHYTPNGYYKFKFTLSGTIDASALFTALLD